MTDEKTFYEYVKTHNLKEVYNGMHSDFLDANGELKAQRIHGFAFDMYSIKDWGDNLETVDIVKNLIS